MANLVRRVSQSAEQIVGDLKDLVISNKTKNANNNNNYEDQKIDPSNIKKISHPTKSFSVRSGTYEQQLTQVEIELKHAHMQLKAERDKVRELESTLKGVVEKKYKNDTNIISQLQQSQNKLRKQLGLVIQSKMDLCESTANEIERLRRIIQILMNQLYKATGQTAILPDINKYFINNYDNDNISVNNNNNNNNNNLNGDDDNTQLSNFPHNNESKIDLRIIEKGDGKSFAEPFASVDLKYTGFIYHRDSNKWTKFTNEEISNTIFETKLGNNENIIGLEQAVLSMTKGEIAQVYVPSRLAYGVHGAKPLIPANADLIFKLTLVEIHNDNPMDNDDINYDSEENDEDINDDNIHATIDSNNNDINAEYNTNMIHYGGNISGNDDDDDEDDIDDDGYPDQSNDMNPFGATSLNEPFQDL